MYKNKKIIALIPARAGSKGLPRKNILPLFGKPLIAWTIEQAKKSKYIDKIIVSTDDKEIAETAKLYGAEIPFLRPKELASDQSKGIDVILHAIKFLEKEHEDNFILIYLQPTSPLRTADDIDSAIGSLFDSTLKKSIVSVCEAEHHPLLANTLPKNLNMKNFLNKEFINKNRQDLPKYYRLNGSIYVGYVDYIKENQGFFGESTFAYIMPFERSIDIDTMIDFKLAEIMLSYKNNR